MSIILVKAVFRGSEYFSQEKYLIRRLKTALTRMTKGITFYRVIRDKRTYQVTHDR